MGGIAVGLGGIAVGCENLSRGVIGVELGVSGVAVETSVAVSVGTGVFVDVPTTGARAIRVAVGTKKRLPTEV